MNTDGDASPLLAVIRDRMSASDGILSLEEFMELALYHPQYGYYERGQDQIGIRGDFFTSVSVGPAFGKLLSYRFAEWTQSIPKNHPLVIAEAGAHDGTLASDILSQWKTDFPEFYQRCRYVIIEPSRNRRLRQKGRLVDHTNVEWVSDSRSLRETTDGGATGIVFSNELFDAFAIRRFGWSSSERDWFEWGVRWNDQANRLAWCRMPRGALPVKIRELPPELLHVLPDEFVVEYSPNAARMWRELGSSLRLGWLLTFDYGGIYEERFRPERSNGSLRAFANHQWVENILDRPGEQDLTADVDFSELQLAGEGMGFTTEFFGSQERWLSGVIQSVLSRPTQVSWNQSDLRQFQTLAHPSIMGSKFKVIVQTKT